MLAVNLRQYAEAHWENHIKPLSQISLSKEDASPMVDSDYEAYSYDDIVASLFPEDKKPTSVDGLWFDNKTIYLVEFKSGFEDIISTRNFDYEKAKCEATGDVCKQYWELFRKKRKLETNKLRNSIMMKAAETYITLEKKILPMCEIVKDANYKLVLWVVIDANSNDSEEDILAFLSGVGSPESNEYEKVRKGLKRFMQQKDCDGHDYFYDDIRVLSPIEFEQKIHKVMLA